MILLTPRLTRAQAAAIVILYQAGCSAGLDMQRQVYAGNPLRRLPGGLADWIVLVALGFVAGEGGRLILTEAGRKLAEDEIAGRTKEAS